jgi:hypothetical protein
MANIKHKRNTHNAFVGTPEGKEQLGRNGNSREGQTGYFFYL